MANTNEVQRRDLLRGAAVALGVAFLPGIGRASSEPASLDGFVEQVRRNWYRPKIERLAEELKAQFVSGELHGYNDTDSQRDEDDPTFKASSHRLENELAEELGCGEARDGYLILACSQSEPLVYGGSVIDDPARGAAEAMVYDVIRIARQRGWYTVTPGEAPTNEDLGIA